METDKNLELVVDQQAQIVRSIQTIKSEVLDAVQKNQESITSCIQAGEAILSEIERAQMNDELDQKAAIFIKRARETAKSVNERRKPVTQIFDVVKKGFTAMEALISPKEPNGIVARLQAERDKYAAYKLEQQRHAEEERQKILRQQEQRRRIAELVKETMYRILAEQIRRQGDMMADLFASMTIETATEAKGTLDGWPVSLDIVSLLKTQYKEEPNELNPEEAAAIANSTYKENADEVIRQYKEKIEEMRDGYLLQYPSRVNALKELKAAEEERARKEAELLKAAEEERARKEAELKAAEEERARKEAELLKAAEEERREQQRKIQEEEERREQQRKIQESAAQAQSLFEQASSVKVEAKITKEIVVTDSQGWLQIISQWWTVEGVKLTNEELTKKLSFMLTACQRHFNKTEEYIISPYIQYIEKIKAK